MKPIIFAVFFIGLALNARAQQNQQVDSASPGQWVRLNSGTPDRLSHVDYVAQDTIWTGSLRSTDGGTTWLTVPQPGSSGFFQSAWEGISIVDYDGDGYVTHNAWQTWDTIHTGAQGITNACWASPDTCFLVGNVNARSTDGGVSWNLMTFSPSPVTLSAVSFCNTKVGYVVGSEAAGPFPYQNQMAGECYKTTDGGAHWIQLFTAIQSSLYAVATLNPDTVLVMGTAGIYWSTDGGNTWDWQTPVFTFQAGGGLAFSMKGNNGFLVGGVPGGGGYIIHTTDAGTTWTQESNSSTPGILYSVAMLNDTDAIAVGDNGVILKRESGSSGVSQQRDLDSLAVQTFPNPAQQLVTFSYTLPSSQNVTMVITNTLGQIIATPLQGVLQNTGLQSVPVSTANYSSSTYYYQLSSTQYSANGSFTVIQ